MVQTTGRHARIAALSMAYASDPRLPEVHTFGATAEGRGSDNEWLLRIWIPLKN
jgi:hypothetical protein